MVALSFVIDRARFVMTSLLEEAAFASILPGNPAIFVDTNGTGLPQRLFPGATAVGRGFAAEGTATCSRGIHYHIYLRAEPLIDPTNEITNDELTFSFYQLPRFSNQSGWASCTLVAENSERNDDLPSVFDPLVVDPPDVVVSPYRYFPPGATRVWGPEEEFRNGPFRYDQRQISRPNPDGGFYLMQRLVLQIRWNASPDFYNNPQSPNGRPQRIHLVAYKANLD